MIDVPEELVPVLNILKGSTTGLTREQLMGRVALGDCPDNLDDCLEQLKEMGLARDDTHPPPTRWKALNRAWQ